MEGLTKQQIVLVTLLVSFVTSIATGIVTVALMDQAPPGVTQNINRIVERTIEKVAPSSNQAAAVVTKETVVVKEDDLVVAAVEKNTKSLVSIFKTVGQGNIQTEAFAGNGLVVSKEGLVATDAAAVSTLDGSQNPPVQNLKATFSDGAVLPLTTVSSDGATGITFLKPMIDDKTKNTVFTPASFADAGSLKLGQTVIALGGDKVSVAVGIVSNLAAAQSAAAPAPADSAVSATSTDTTAANPPASAKNQIIKTDVSAPGKALGGILVNLSGDVVGVRLASAGNSDNLFLPAGLVAKAVAKSATPASSSAQVN